jgi:enoyl-CoA hydratase/carnithine racemase
MDIVRTEEQDEVSVVTLCGGVTNPINLETVEALATALDNVKDNDTKGVVLTSESDKFFSIGFDLPRLLDLGRDGVSGFYTAFNEMAVRLYTLPKPTVSAVKGHCVAGGCILAALTDFRFMAEGKGRGGVNELKLGVPVPYFPTLVLTQVLGDRVATEMIYTGDLYPQDWLKEVGFIDRIVPPGELMDEAMEYVSGLGSNPNLAFSSAKAARTEPVKLAYFEKQDEDMTKFLECWFQEDTQALLEEAKKKF